MIKNNKTIKQLLDDARIFLINKNFEDLKILLNDILSMQHRNVDALEMMGIVHAFERNFKDAIFFFTNAIKNNPTNARLLFNRANAFFEFGKYSEALFDIDKSLLIDSYNQDSHLIKGNSLKEMGLYSDSLNSYNDTLRINPNFYKALVNKGCLLTSLEQYEEAINLFGKAISLEPNFPEAYNSRGNALLELKKLDAAVSSYDKAISLKPDYEYLLGLKQHAKMFMCKWQDFDSTVLEISHKIRNNIKVTPCFPVLSLPIALAELRQAAEIWNSDKHPYNPSLGPISKTGKRHKIRVGYFSSDFYNHATAYLMAELFELHNKGKFELIAFSFGPNSNDQMRKRISEAFDQFLDVVSMTDKDVAKLSRELGIDIAIDLKGSTKGSRLGIFSYKAAPIQVSYLGYPGTLGVDYMDYLIADKTLILKSSQTYYSEKIVYLPHCYQVNDRQREIAYRNFTKQELGLPNESFVFCSFNNLFKITPTMFDLWVNILKAVDGSVLWLLEDNEIGSTSLLNEAEKRGLDSTRLIFAKRLELAEHLSRHSAADLFLDTLPYNAHTTASDALWAGLPVVTCMGESFASRVAGSLLNAIGLSELVTQTPVEYVNLAIELATNPFKLNAIKKKLEQNRLTTPLFDTPSFTKHIEAAYTKMYDRYHADIPLDHIYIDV